MAARHAIKTHVFGATGMQVGALGFGAAEIGFERATSKTVDALLGVAADVGINVIDTAAMYAGSEEALGRALHGRRNQCLLFTKCGRCFPPRSSWLGLQVRTSGKLQRFTRGPDEQESAWWHPRVLQWSIERSLRRLKTEWIDLLQLHSCPEETLRRGDVIEVLRRARQAGKVRHIGYSGDGPAALYAVRCGQFDALQTSVNIADQEALDLTLPLARERAMGVIAKRPIANGCWSSAEPPRPSHLHAYWERLRELHYEFLQNEHAVQTALTFTLSAPGVHTAIVGTTNPAHLRQNAECAAAGVLDETTFSAIRAAWKKAARPDWAGQM
jgi:aryl-alcohol dehydrogenase-like predicted oxidoreductase